MVFDKLKLKCEECIVANKCNWLNLSILTVSTSLLLGNAVFAATAEELLTRDLSTAIGSLKEDTRFYNYFEITANVPVEDTTLAKSDVRYQYVRDYVLRGSSLFWNMNHTKTSLANAGPGLYLAVDPFASSPAAAPETGFNFGYSMVELTLGAGTKYLNTVQKPAVKKDTLAALKAEGYLNSTQQAALLAGGLFTRDTLRYMVEAQNSQFRALVHRIFKAENIALIEYGWQTGVSAFCGGVPKRSALVYVGSDQINVNVVSNILVYWKGFPASKVSLTNEEIQVKERNAKLYSVLKAIRPDEKIFINSKSSSARKAALAKINSVISSAYTDKFELNEIQSKTFKCLK